jgi:hypothetical protein
LLIVTSVLKLAVTLFGASIVNVTGFAVPVTLPDQPLN